MIVGFLVDPSLLFLPGEPEDMPHRSSLSEQVFFDPGPTAVPGSSGYRVSTAMEDLLKAQ